MHASRYAIKLRSSQRARREMMTWIEKRKGGKPKDISQYDDGGKVMVA